MYSDWVVPAVAGLMLWAGVLTYFVWRQENFLKSLFPKSGERDIRKKFEENLKTIEDYGLDLGKFKNKLSR